MALPTQQIESIISQLHKFGEDDTAFDAWLATIAPLVRAHGPVGAFRSEARALWLANNKSGVEALVRRLFAQPNNAERRALETGEPTGLLSDATYLMFLSKMGIRKGDTLTLHTSNGNVASVTFDLEGLPVRENDEPKPKKKRASRKKSPKKEEPKLLVEDKKTSTRVDEE